MTTTLYQAGAGSGKTYTITREISRRLAEGLDPEGLIATTFTKKAAAELRDRIRDRILRPQDGDVVLDEAERMRLVTGIEGSLIGTVHSIGYQLLRRYALRLGLSPRLEPLEEAAQERHLRSVRAGMPAADWQRFAELARRLGQEDEQDLVLKLLSEKRVNRIPNAEFQDQLIRGGERYLQVMAPGGPDISVPDWDALYESMQGAADALERYEDTTQATENARRGLRGMIRSRRREWSEWGRVAGMEAGKRSGANDELHDLRSLGARVRLHPGLHEDIRDFLALAAKLTLDLEAHYEAYKRRHGLVDYTDQEDYFLRLLEDESVREDFAAKVRLLVVDEFQDSSPVQLAIFEKLRGIAKEVIWVGDKKQAIYGFRGTDPRLMEDVMQTVPGRETLQENWRSRAGLVRFVNNVFDPVFGDAALEPASKDGAVVHAGPSTVKRWRISGRSNAEKHAQLATAIRGSAEAYSGTAVLVRTNKQAQEIGQALREQGVPVVVRVPGLLATREGALTYSGLRFVADRRDQVAAAQIRHLLEDFDGEAPQWLLDRLEDRDTWMLGPDFDRLAAIPAQAANPATVFAEVLQALRLPERIAAWGGPDRRSANLDALAELGVRYEEEARQEGKAPTLTGLVAWLRGLAGDGEDMLPLPAGSDAVTVMTVHKAKGLEWDTVILYLDERSRKPAWHELQVGGGDASRGAPLRDRWVRLWPYPFGFTYGSPSNDGANLSDAVLATDEGRDVQEREAEERKRLLYVAFTRARKDLVLVHGRNEPPSLAAIQLAHTLPLDGSGTLQDDASYECVDLVATEPEAGGAAAAWFDLEPGPGDHIQRYWAPSQEPPIEEATVEAEALPGEHTFPRVKDVDWIDVGHAVHAYLASLPGLRDLDDAGRLRHAEACLRRWNVTGVEAENLVIAGKRLQGWVEGRWPGARWHAEVPVTGPRPEGGQWIGAIDLLLETPEGMIIIDHKSADYAPEGWEEKAIEHSGQIAAYVRLAGAQRGFIHLPLGGGSVAVRTDAQHGDDSDTPATVAPA